METVGDVINVFRTILVIKSKKLLIHGINWNDN